MEAIEFVAQEKDGIIKLPKKYHGILKAKFRVIILVDTSDEEPLKGAKLKKELPQLDFMQLKTKGFKFSREEANER